MATQIQFKRGTAAALASVNPFLNAGEPCFETDTDRFKIGDGVLNWNALPYQASAGASSAPVQTVAGRTGDVVISTEDVVGLAEELANINVEVIDGGDYVGVVVEPTSNITITSQPQSFNGVVGTVSAQTKALPSGSWGANFSFGNDLYWKTSSNASSGDYYAVSSDGLNWTKRYGLNRAGNWYAAVHGGGKTAISDGSYLQVSSDGTTWTESAVSGKVFFANGKWFRYTGPASVTSASSWNSLTLYQSDDLVSWSTAGTVSKTFSGGSGTTHYYKPANGCLSSVVYYNGAYFAFFDETADTRYQSGLNNYYAGLPWVFTSTDLSTWTAVLGGPTGFAGWSNDFAQVTASSSFRLQWNNPRTVNSELLVETKSSSSGGRTFARTSDGESWTTKYNLSGQIGSQFYSVSHGNGVYVMPAGTKIYSSTNATTWVERTNPAPQSGFNVSFFVDGNFWLISRDDTSSVALRSANGIDWTEVTGLPSIGPDYLVQNGSTLVGGSLSGTSTVRLSLSGTAVQAEFSISAFYGPGSVTYQWQVSTNAGATWANISGATLSTLSFAATVSDNGKRYRCIISAAGSASVTSNPATLTVT